MSDMTFTSFTADSALRPSIEVQLDRAATSGYTAIVRLCGEHDLATAVDVQDKLDSIWGNVLVDLSECDFIDSTVISVLIRDSRARAREGHDLELLTPLENETITRTLEVAGLRDALVIHTCEPAIPRGFATAS
jgi:anti-anti-sigma factor